MFHLKSKAKRKFFNIYLQFFNYKFKSVFISKKSRIESITLINEGTRINGPVIIKGQGELCIGKYCAVGENLRVITSNHDTKYLNLQLMLQVKIGAMISHNKAKKIIIGNNVWIGDSVIILPNVRIGDGAVIGAGSVVTKDVEEYCIYAGNPAKFIKKRFSDEILVVIKKIKWWNLSHQDLLQMKHIFSKPIVNNVDELKLIAKNFLTTNK